MRLPVSDKSFGEAPDYIEPLTAYRAWKLVNNRLLSLNNVPWLPKQAMVAECTKRHEHTPPLVDCTCGIYAGKNLEHLHDIGYAQRGHLHGEVSMWGMVMDCSLGYRAQYAYPKYFVIQPRTLLGRLCEAETCLRLLSEFDIDIYVANESQVSRDMNKTLLKEKGVEGFVPEGVARLTSGIQHVYDTMSEIANQPPTIGSRLHIMGKINGIAIITEITDKDVCAKLFNTVVCRVPRKEIRWNIDNGQFECRPSSISTRVSR